MLLVVVYLTLTDPLRIQPWSKIDETKRNETANNFGEKKQGKKTEDTNKKVASKGHGR